MCGINILLVARLRHFNRSAKIRHVKIAIEWYTLVFIFILYDHKLEHGYSEHCFVYMCSSVDRLGFSRCVGMWNAHVVTNTKESTIWLKITNGFNICKHEEMDSQFEEMWCNMTKWTSQYTFNKSMKDFSMNSFVSF